MAKIDDNGLIFSEPGDILRVEQRLRASNYGELLGPKPDILVWHLTGNNIPSGANDSSRDGTKGMAGRIEAGTARYYAHAYLGRDGVLWQVIPFTRAAIHVAGKYQGREANRVSSGIEITNLGWVRPNGQAPGFKVDVSREDMRQDGAWYWQMLTFQQNTAVLELADAWRRWTGAVPDDCIRGHNDVDPDSSHVDPGPDFRPFLLGPVKAHLEAMVL